MEQYYRKVGKRYVPAGYSIPDMGEGLYWRQKIDQSLATCILRFAFKEMEGS